MNTTSKVPPPSVSPRQTDMGAHAPEHPRYECKMVCRETVPGAVATQLQELPIPLRRLYPPRRVQSLYFDTVEGRALQENLAGLSERSKLRLRWYGPDASLVMGVLEQKIRRDMLGWKRRLPLDEPMALDGVVKTAFMRDLMSRVSAEWQERLGMGMEPVQWVQYDREYLEAPGVAVRVTVDRGLIAWDQRPRAFLDRTFPTPVPSDLVIVECKAPYEQEAAAREILGRLPFVVDKCSKFVTASAPRHGPIPSVV